jgi:hypothetical protein
MESFANSASSITGIVCVVSFFLLFYFNGLSGLSAKASVLIPEINERTINMISDLNNFNLIATPHVKN